MAATGVTNGDTIQYTVPAGQSVRAGDLVRSGLFVGVAHTDLAAGETGTLEIVGVWSFPKVNRALSQGQLVHWVHDANPQGGTAGAGAIEDRIAQADHANDIENVGIVWEAAAATAEEVKVLLAPTTGVAVAAGA